MKTIIRIEHVPPSSNNIYANVPGKGRVASSRLKTWRIAAGWDLQRAKPHKWTVPVYLTIAIGKLPANSDLSNRVKAIEDLLVTHQIIPGDTIKWVRGINCYLAQVPFKGVEIAITAADPLVTAVENAA